MVHNAPRRSDITPWDHSSSHNSNSSTTSTRTTDMATATTNMGVVQVVGTIRVAMTRGDMAGSMMMGVMAEGVKIFSNNKITMSLGLGGRLMGEAVDGQCLVVDVGVR